MYIITFDQFNMIRLQLQMAMHITQCTHIVGFTGRMNLKHATTKIGIRNIYNLNDGSNFE